MKKRIYVFLGIVAVLLIFLASSAVKNARLVSNLTVYENLVTPTASVTIENDDLNETINYRDGATRTDADHIWADTVSGSGTLDLTSLTNVIGEALDLTDEIIMAIKFKLEDDAGASVVIDEAASASYNLFGATYSFTLLANQSLLFKCDTNLPVISDSAKGIDYDVSNDSSMLSIILISADSYQ